MLVARVVNEVPVVGSPLAPLRHVAGAFGPPELADGGEALGARVVVPPPEHAVRVMPGVQRGAVLLPAVGLAVVPAACTQRSSARRGAVSQSGAAVRQRGVRREQQSVKRKQEQQENRARAAGAQSREQGTEVLLEEGGVQLQVEHFHVLQRWYL